MTGFPEGLLVVFFPFLCCFLPRFCSREGLRHAPRLKPSSAHLQVDAFNQEPGLGSPFKEGAPKSGPEAAREQPEAVFRSRPVSEVCGCGGLEHPSSQGLWWEVAPSEAEPPKNLGCFSPPTESLREEPREFRRIAGEVSARLAWLRHLELLLAAGGTPLGSTQAFFALSTHKGQAQAPVEKKSLPFSLRSFLLSAGAAAWLAPFLAFGFHFRNTGFSLSKPGFPNYPGLNR